MNVRDGDSVVVDRAEPRSGWRKAAIVGAVVLVIAVAIIVPVVVLGGKGGGKGGGGKHGDLPVFPKEYSAVVVMSMPYIPMEMTMRVLTSAETQKVEYYDGLQVEVKNASGAYKYVFNNSKRVCMFSPDSPGPKFQGGVAEGGKFEATSWFPDLSMYTKEDDELVGGIMCHKYSLKIVHGTAGTMNDAIVFYWDPVLEKPVRWHIHARHPIFGSHTDEYIMDFMDFKAGAPSAEALQIPSLCSSSPQTKRINFQMHGFLDAFHALHMPESRDALDFDSFLSQYGKSFSVAERRTRQTVFAANARLIQKLNVQHAGQTHFRGNQFLDMTTEEYMSFRGGWMKGTRLPEHQKWVHAFKPTSKDLPKDFDWRVASVVSDVKDQAACGSCWTYSLTEAVETAVAIQTGSVVLLPEQFILDCTWANGANQGCDGGDPSVGALEVIRKFGGMIPTAEAYGSYMSVDGYCKDTHLMEVGATLTGWVNVGKVDDEIREALVTNGVLSIGIMVPPEMLYYDTGVLNVDSCTQDETKIDHAVALVGFVSDDTDPTTLNSWTVRNSWSTYWGDQGYINIARGKKDCCVSCAVGYPQVSSGGKMEAKA